MKALHLSDPQNLDYISRPRFAPIELGDLRSRMLVGAYTLWNERRGDQTMPSRDALGPRDMKKFLRDVLLLKVIDAGVDFELSVVGDNVVSRYKFAVMGKRLSQIVHPGNSDAFELWRAIVRERAPSAHAGWVETDKEVFGREILNLPLGSTEVSHILVITHYVALGNQHMPGV